MLTSEQFSYGSACGAGLFFASAACTLANTNPIAPHLLSGGSAVAGMVGAGAAVVDRLRTKPSPDVEKGIQASPEVKKGYTPYDSHTQVGGNGKKTN